MNQFYGPTPPANPYPAPPPAAQGYPAQSAAPPYPAYPPQPMYYAPPAYGAPAFAVKVKDPRKVRARFTLNRTAAILLLQVTASVLMNLLVLQIFLAVGIDAEGDGLCLTLMSGALSPICTALPALLYMIVYKGSWGDFLRFEKTGFFYGLLWVFAGLGLAIAANYPALLVESLLESLGARDPSSVAGQGDDWLSFGMELFIIAILVPFVEEFAFRGVIFSALRPFGQGFALVGSALIFGMAHLNLSSVVFATIAGLGMALAYAKTGNLWVSTLIHAANNGLAILGSYIWMLPIDAQAQELFNVLLSVVPLVLGTLSFILLMVIGHRRKQRARRGAAPGRQAQPVNALPPLGSGETATCILSTPLIWAAFALVLLETSMLFLL